MSVFNALLREHAAFRKLAKRLRRAPDHDPDTARQELRACLLLLLPALDRHESLEDEMFGDANPQHAALDRIKERLREALSDADLRKTAELSELSKSLARLLVRHFDDEEKLIWPEYKRIMERTLDNSFSKRAERHATQLEQEILLNRKLVDEYLGGLR